MSVIIPLCEMLAFELVVVSGMAAVLKVWLNDFCTLEENGRNETREDRGNVKKADGQEKGRERRRTVY